MSRFILFLLVLCAMPLRAAQTMADFSTATPVSTDYVVGYRPPMGSGAERRFTVAQLNTFFSSNITGITNSQISSLAWGKLTGTPTTLSGYGITDAQPADADLTYLASFTPTANVKAILNAADYAAIRTLLGVSTGSGDMVGSNNLSDVANAATARSNLGLGSVNNTSDAAKPVSTAQQTALDLKSDAARGINDHGNAGTSVTLTWSAATPTHKITLNSSSCAVTLAGFTSSKDCVLTVQVVQDATGGRALTYSPTLAGGGTPTLDTTAAGVTWLQFWSLDGGTTIFYTTTAGGGGGSGDVVGPSSSVDGEMALFNSTTGKLIKRATTTGMLKATSGVIGPATSGTDYEPARTTVDQSTAEAGASTTVYAWTPQRVAQAIAQLAAGGSAEPTGTTKFIPASGTYNSVPAGWSLTGVNGIPAFTSPDADFQAITKTAGTVATPTMSPAGGSYGSTQSVTITSATSGSTISYTTNGTTPSRTVGTTGASPLSGISVSATSTLKAMAFKDYYVDSGVATESYTITADVTAPTQSGAWTIDTNGTTHTLVFSEAVQIGGGGSTGFTANMTGGNVALTYSSGNATNTLVFTGNRTVLSSETEGGSKGIYVQPGNGIEDAAGNDLASFTGHTITNNSTQTGGVTPGWVYNYSTAQASADSSTFAGWTFGATVTASQNATVTKVSVRMKYANYAGQILKAELYNNATGARLSNGSSYTNSGFQSDVDIEVTLGNPVSVTAGTAYRVEFVTSDDTFGTFAKYSSGSGGRIDYSNGYGAFPPATSTTSSDSGAIRVGIYEQ